MTTNDSQILRLTSPAELLRAGAVPATSLTERGWWTVRVERGPPDDLGGLVRPLKIAGTVTRWQRKHYLNFITDEIPIIRRGRWNSIRQQTSHLKAAGAYYRITVHHGIFQHHFGIHQELRHVQPVEAPAKSILHKALLRRLIASIGVSDGARLAL